MKQHSRLNLLETLKIDEGVKYEIYYDHRGFPTFGIGHLIKSTEPEFYLKIGTPVSEERVLEAFEADLDIMLEDCRAVFSDWDELPEVVHEIIGNMIFNLGRTRFSKFVKFIAAINNRDWKTAAKEGRDSRWYRQVTNRAERLMVAMENV